MPIQNAFGEMDFDANSDESKFIFDDVIETIQRLLDREFGRRRAKGLSGPHYKRQIREIATKRLARFKERRKRAQKVRSRA